MSRLRFGCFLAPHHPLGENPTLLYRRDLNLVAQLDELGYDEFWCGEHHSTGWEMIASPEMFLAAAAERTKRIKLGTGVLSLPYHHPFNVAQRIVQLDHMSMGRAIFGSGPGALASDAKMLRIDPLRQRDMQDEALGVIIRLLKGETVSHESDWFVLDEAALQILPLQENLPMAVASSISPSGMKLAGKYGIGVLSIASNSTEGLAALPTQWSFAEDAAAQSGMCADRNQWRVLMSWHLAESQDQARSEAVDGLQKWNNEYAFRVLGRPDAVHVDDKWELLEQATSGTTVIGTPDDMCAAIQKVLDLTGGFGTVIGFAHDWANPEATRRSWDLFARRVIPEFNGMLAPMRRSADHVAANKKALMAGAGAAIVAQIKRDERASAAFGVTLAQRAAMNAGSSAAAGAAMSAAKPVKPAKSTKPTKPAKPTKTAGTKPPRKS
jgi:limonene 1,2-monooxygenase